MPLSLSAVYLHIIFSTKGRHAWLQDLSLRARLHEFIGGAARQIDCQPLAIGGVEDHVPILCMLGRQTTHANLVKELKRTSTLWLKASLEGMQDFSWQAGYAAFSVSRGYRMLGDTWRIRKITIERFPIRTKSGTCSGNATPTGTSARIYSINIGILGIIESTVFTSDHSWKFPYRRAALDSPCWGW